MAPRQTYILSPTTVNADRATLIALRDIVEYAPRNPAHSVDNLIQLEAAHEQAELEVNRLRRLLDAARNQMIQTGWAFHEGILGARSEVIVQFGPDAQAVQDIGLKRRSARKRPVRRQTATAG